MLNNEHKFTESLESKKIKIFERFEQICIIYFPSLREQFREVAYATHPLREVAYATHPRPLVLAAGD